VKLTIPNTTLWQRARKAWGEPEFVISAIEPSGRWVFCMEELPVQIELRDLAGNPIALRPGYPPYGYSSLCRAGSLRFAAAGGSDLTLLIKNRGEAAELLPAGEIIIVGAWSNTKDKIVGVAVSTQINSLLKWPTAVGCIVVLAGSVLLLARRAR
jgi:hypothetical protein